jgi:hypothetical protein
MERYVADEICSSTATGSTTTTTTPTAVDTDDVSDGKKYSPGNVKISAWRII